MHVGRMPRPRGAVFGGPAAVALAVALLAVACAGSGAAEPDASTGSSSTDSSAGPDAGSGEPSPEAITGEGVGRRIGSGRAAMGSTGGSATVIATTVGVRAFVGGVPVALEIDPDRGPVTFLETSPDGSQVVLAWPDGTELWSLAEPTRLLERFGPVEHARYMGDDRLLVVEEAAVEVRSTVDGQVVDRHDAVDGRRMGAPAADPGGGWWAVPVSLADGSTEILSSVDGAEPIARPLDAGPGLAVFQTAADPTAPRVFVGLSEGGERFAGGEVIVWDLVAGAVSGSYRLDAAVLWAVGSEGDLAMANSESLRVIASDGAEREPLPTPGGLAPYAVHGLGAGGFALVLQDAVPSLAIATSDGIGSQPIGLSRFVSSSRQASDRSFITVVDHTGEVSVLGPDGAIEREIDDFVAGTINDIAISSGQEWAVATSTGEVRLFDGDRGDGWLTDLADVEGNVDTVVFSHDGSRLIAGMAERQSDVIFDDTITVWGVEDRNPLVRVGGEREEVPGCGSFTNVLRLASDGSFVVGVSHDFTVFVLDGSTYERRLSLPPHAGPVLDVALSPDDRHLVTTAQDSTLRVWDLASDSLAAEYSTALGGYRSVDFLPGGERLVVADFTGGLHVLDLLTGERLSTFDSTISGDADVEVSPSGSLVASGEGSVLRLWSVESGQVVAEFDGHFGTVTTAAFSPDGSAVVSGSMDGTAIVWDLVA